MRSPFRFLLLPLAIAAAFAPAVLANPLTPSVVAGQASFVQSAGNVLTIQNSPGAIINWQSFDIARGETTRFVQQSAASQVLNRVTGGSPSQILGTLQSNGRVILINPNGIAFGRDAQVDVAGLLASTLQLSDADFLAGRFNFSGGTATVSNSGTLRTQQGGEVILLGGNVENSGLIASPEGNVLLAAGRSITLASPQNPALQIELANNEQHAINLGTVLAKQASLYGTLSRNSGVIEASSAVRGDAGRIILRGSRQAENSGTLSANGATAGAILLQADNGTTLAGGVIQANAGSGSNTQAATDNATWQAQPAQAVLVDGANSSRGAAINVAAQAGTGGSIQLLGQKVAVLGGSHVSATGALGGGVILVGGDWQGGNGAIQNAQFSYVGLDAVLDASAGSHGNGGKIVVWSDDTTRVYGRLFATGGSSSGNGGQIETSGKKALDVTQAADASASHGQRGNWLLDPGDIIITEDVFSDSNISGGPDFSSGSLDAFLRPRTITSALNQGTDVTITSGLGGIEVNSEIIKSGGSAATLTLTAQTYINLNRDIDYDPMSDPLSIVLNGNVKVRGYTADPADRSITLSGNQITINGTLNLQNATLTLAADSAANLALSGGASSLTLDNSVLQDNGHSRMVINTDSATLGGGSNITANLTVSGALDASGYRHQGTLTTSGSSTVGAGGIAISSGVWTNQGTLTLHNGGYIDVGQDGQLVNAAAGVLNLQDADSETLRSSGNGGDISFINHGTLHAAGGQVYNLQLAQNTFGTNDMGTVLVDGGSTLNLLGTHPDDRMHFSSLTLDNGTISVDNSPAIRIQDGGSLNGSGTINGNVEIAAAATVAPGNTSGSTLAINGDLSLEAGSRLNIDIAGLDPASTLDRINVSGNVQLGGTLTVALGQGYQPASGASYRFMTMAGHSGAFADTVLPPNGSLLSSAGALDWLAPVTVTPPVTPPLTPSSVLQTPQTAQQIALDRLQQNGITAGPSGTGAAYSSYDYVSTQCN